MTFLSKNFGKPIRISYNRKYFKRDVVFWKLMDNVSFQTAFFLCICNMFFAQSNSISPCLNLFLCFFPCFFFCLFLCLCPLLFLCIFVCFFLLLPSQLHCYLLPKFNWLLAQVNLMVYHQNLINFLNFLPIQI